MALRTAGWALVFSLLAGLAIPWFLWGSSRLVAGLPVWLWWHIGWMALAAIVFHTFTRRAWGLWIVDEADVEPDATDPGGGDR